MVIVHGEVKPELQQAADEVMSTSQMAKYVEAHPEKTRLAILTECGLVVRLELEHPEKQFYKPCRLCEHMKAIDLENVYLTLRDEPPECRVTVPEDVRAGAARAMERMIELGVVSGDASSGEVQHSDGAVAGHQAVDVTADVVAPRHHRADLRLGQDLVLALRRPAPGPAPARLGETAERLVEPPRETLRALERGARLARCPRAR